MTDQPTPQPEHSAIPWVERYRPKELNDVSHQGEIVATLKNAVETNRLPHLLFYGPPGTGEIAFARSKWLQSNHSHNTTITICILSF